MPPNSSALPALFDSMRAMGAALSALQKALPAAAPAKQDWPTVLACVSAEMEALTAATDAATKFGSQLSASELKAQASALRDYVKPLLVTAPFAHRCLTKPLGYSGDYGTVNCILGDPFQGDDAYSQLLNYFLLQHDIAEGHRNRINILHRLLLRKAAEAHANGTPFRVLSIGCGPAEETYRFLRDCPAPEVADITLLDFSREALDWAGRRLEALQAPKASRARVRLVEDSVYNLAKKPLASVSAEYDLVICAGLFDYLTDRFCQRVLAYGVKALRSEGVLLVTNVSPCADRVLTKLLLDWDLIYRSVDELSALLPKADTLGHQVYVDSTGTNIVAEIRKLA